ncbi:hypothetical protein Ssi02_51640 [Sinosporangium siamense]|uniref:Uncharacterized protein n=1 Tax=Sinosporangium siamense TaxID=1367973 RepID=A0A919RJH0_9ACTN|nr:hypothetical protein Ssi02_51640 [Sinosporangium siamense]
MRVFGYQQSGNNIVPLLHSKMLVLGGTYEDDEDFTGVHFVPDIVWIGSANWTDLAANLHEESATAVADRSFVKDATNFVIRIISESEPLEQCAVTPRPDLAPVDFDMEAFAEFGSNGVEYFSEDDDG